MTVLDQSIPAEGEGNYIYQGSVPASESGTYGFSVRVVPTHPHLMQTHELRLITWSYVVYGPQLDRCDLARYNRPELSSPLESRSIEVVATAFRIAALTRVESVSRRASCVAPASVDAYCARMIRFSEKRSHPTESN